MFYFCFAIVLFGIRYNIFMKNYKFIVSGRVQGVFYRKNIHANSLKAGFNGYVKNLPDGTVEACISCEENRFKEFIEILKQGSPNSIVNSVKWSEITGNFQDNFQILY